MASSKGRAAIAPRERWSGSKPGALLLHYGWCVAGGERKHEGDNRAGSTTWPFGGRRRRSGHVIARAAPKWPSCEVSLPMKIHTITISPSQTRVPDSRVHEQESLPRRTGNGQPKRRKDESEEMNGRDRAYPRLLLRDKQIVNVLSAKVPYEGGVSGQGVRP
jgi:hypothetical protein